MKAVIFAGGQGKRLRPLTDNIPKCMVEVGGKPIIEWQIGWLKKHGVDSFVVLAGYLREKVVEFIESRNFDATFAFSFDDAPLGKGGALKKAHDMLEGEPFFFAVNGDIITNIDLDKLTLAKDSVATLALKPLRSPFGIVNTAGKKVHTFEEKPVLKEYWINAGVYAMSGELVNRMPERGDFEEGLFPELAKEGLLDAVKFDDVYWRSVESIKDRDEVDIDLAGGRVFQE